MPPLSRPAPRAPARPGLTRPAAPRIRCVTRTLAVAGTLAVALTGCTRAGAGRATPAPGQARAIVVSFDSFNEGRFRATAGPEVAPALHAYFREAACADAARPAFPSKTSPGHAALWTGSYGNVTGISVNSQALLPMDQHSLLETGSGFSAGALRAEPVWVTAGLAGLRVAGDQATQTPEAPGYPPVATTGDPRGALLDSLRARGHAAVARPGVLLLNGYDSTFSADQVVTERTATPRAAGTWRNASSLGARATGAREVAAPLGDHGDSLFVLFTKGDAGFDRAIVASSRDVKAGVAVAATPADTAWPGTRPLARHFSAPVTLTVRGHALPVSVRLFALAPDLSHFMLFVPALQRVNANVAHGDAGDAYARAIGGWVGNSAAWVYAAGDFGPRLDQGGDGTAEARWMETAEYLIRQEMRGTDWMWAHQSPRLLLEYSPLIDDTDHVLYGLVSPRAPGYDVGVATALEQVRRRAYALVDRRFAALRALAQERRAALFLGSDHGMRAVWRGVRPNVVLAAAGLLALDASGRVDLARTKAYSPDGYFVVVNRVARRGGIVAPGEERAVIDSAERVLRAARGEDGAPVFTQFWRPVEHDTLGIGGPTGGDLYFEVGPGYSPDGGTRAPFTRTTRPAGAHGFPSVARDMQAVLCGAGPGLRPHRLGQRRIIDMGPTVLDYLGLTKPVTAVGESLLSLMR